MASILKRIKEAARYTISGIKPDTWMSPLQPIQPFDPIVDGRQWDYPVGRNLFYNPRGTNRFSYDSLRSLARNSELVRLAIETRQDQLDAKEWKIIPVREKGADDKDPLIAEISRWLERPDKIHDWSGWLRVLIEELYVIDAVSLMPRLTRGGSLYSLDLVDGSTIFPLIDEAGRTPMPPNPAYQQILKGVPKADYTMDELLYRVRKTQVNTPYGFSPVEQIAQSAKTDIERAKYTLAYFTEGSVPDAYVTATENMTAGQINDFEMHFNALLEGNAAGRRKLPFLMHGMEVHQLKEAELKNDFDEWLWRKIAFAFSLSPAPLVKEVNRATAESEIDRADSEGVNPISIWVERLINEVIFRFWGVDYLKFSFEKEESVDPQISASIDSELVRAGIMTINQVREKRGMDPVEGGDIPMIATGSGYVSIMDRPQNPLQYFDEETAVKMQKKKPKSYVL